MPDLATGWPEPVHPLGTWEQRLDSHASTETSAPLTRSGQVAAAFIGAATLAAGWRWALLLILYFVTSVSLSRWRARERDRITGSVVAKGGARDATQVLANGGVFAIALLASRLASGDVLAIAACGALAASAADTWATEVGTLFGRSPRSILTMRAVPRGTSGGVSAAGTLAMIAGALFVAGTASVLGLVPSFALVFTGGVAGAVADSLLGATLQQRRWCASCQLSTERAVHDCGTATVQSGGIGWLDNDAVNLLATLAGALAAAALAVAARP